MQVQSWEARDTILPADMTLVALSEKMTESAIFDTDRLLIRRLVMDDFRSFYDMQSNAEVMRYTTGVTYSEEENRKQLRECIECYDRDGNDFWVWAASQKSDNEFVGTVALVPHSDGVELGYRIRRKFFGVGLGKELAFATINYVIKNTQVERLIAMADVRNKASVRILDASQLVYQGEIPVEGNLDRVYHWSRSKETRH